MDCLLAIDQGTTSTRAMLFDSAGRPLARSQRELPQIFPRDGWVEHDPEAIWRATRDLCIDVLGQAGRVAGIGLTNQRETTVVWDRASGRPIANAIVWQDRRGAGHCARLIADGHQPMVRERTGLVLDSYFSATKIAWLLDNVPGARQQAKDGRLAFGTIDSFLLWRLTGGAVHATDATNAARTLLFDIHRQDWDDDLLRLFDIPRGLLPEVRDNAAEFGVTADGLFAGRIPIRGMAGDQQAATIGQCCFSPGMVKSTYGTGCFMMLNTGAVAVDSRNRLLTTLAYRLRGQATYALEGSIFIAGAAVQWLRDGLGMIGSADEIESLAAEGAAGLYFVPAFTGLGAPHWDPEARGAIFGLTRASGRADIARAALEAVCYQTGDLLTAMTADSGFAIGRLRVDGGMVGNRWLMQRLADLLDLPIERPRVSETTALGAAFLAGLQAGLFGSLEDIAGTWEADAVFTPSLDGASRAGLLLGWRQAIQRVLTPRD